MNGKVSGRFQGPTLAAISYFSRQKLSCRTVLHTSATSRGPFSIWRLGSTKKTRKSSVWKVFQYPSKYLTSWKQPIVVVRTVLLSRQAAALWSTSFQKMHGAFLDKLPAISRIHAEKSRRLWGQATPFHFFKFVKKNQTFIHGKLKRHIVRCFLSWNAAVYLDSFIKVICLYNIEQAFSQMFLPWNAPVYLDDGLIGVIKILDNAVIKS